MPESSLQCVLALSSIAPANPAGVCRVPQPFLGLDMAPSTRVEQGEPPSSAAEATPPAKLHTSAVETYPINVNLAAHALPTYKGRPVSVLCGLSMPMEINGSKKPRAGL